MFSPALRIAIAKASAAEELRALEVALTKADALGHIEAAFEARINASKAARGEGPTKLSRAKREQLSDFADDQAALQAQQLVAFEAATSATEIITALSAGLRTDLQFWSGAAKHTHAADWPVVEEFVNAKRELLTALNGFLKSRSTGA
jgi:2-keto-3-deoxy-6-phosphogluconate aldolase